MTHKFYISSANVPYREVYPVWGGGMSQSKDGDVLYTIEMKDEIAFIGEDFRALAILENQYCEIVTVELWRYCGGEGELFWSGQFTWDECKVDRDKCTARVTPSPLTGYECLQGEWEIERNIYSASDAIEVLPFLGEYEIDCCEETSPTITGPDDCHGAQWCLESFRFTGSGPYVQTTCWHRIVADGTCSGSTPQPPMLTSGWQLLDGGCPGTPRYWRCPESSEHLIIKMKTGRTFNDVVESLVSQVGCGLTVKSDFFGINPDATAPSNIAYTFAENYLRHLTIHQKSDVKRPEASDPALSFVFVMKLKDLLDDLRVMMNVHFRIEDGDTVLRLEHISYFSSSVGMDLTSAKMRLLYSGEGDNVKEEAFRFMDDSVGGSKFVYTCGSGSKENRLRLFTNTTWYVQSNLNPEAVSDKGWVLCANEIHNGTYYLIDANTPLFWHNLLANLHRHNRPFPSGSIDAGAQMQFVTWKRRRKQEPFTVPLCCGDTFDPSELVTTPLGDGEVASAEYNVIKDTLKLTLKY